MNNQTATKEIATIVDPLDRKTTGDITISRDTGGLSFREYREAIEFAKLMSQGGDDNVTIPPHCRGKPYVCLAVVTRAMWWKFDPYFVAEHSYVEPRAKRLAFDSSIYQAVVNARAPIKHRMKHRFDGEGDDMTCTVWTTFVGDTEPTEHTSPPLGKLRPKINEEGQIKGSPLWGRKPQVQMAYDTMRDFARLHCQDVLGGIYDKDEFEEYEDDFAQPKDVSPNLIERLPGKIEGAGFAEAVVDQGLAQQVESTKTKTKRSKSKAASEPKTEPKTEPEPVQAENAGETATKVLEPKTAAEYLVYCEAWINGITAQTAEMAESRYHSEQDLRDACGVPIKERKRLNDLVVDKIEAFQTEAIDGAKPA